MLRFSRKSSLLSVCAAAALLTGMATSSQAATTVYGGGSSLASTVYGLMFNIYSASLNPSASYTYVSDGSGAGQRGFLGNAPSNHGLPAGTTIAYGASDATLSAAQISTYATAQQPTTGPLIQLPTFGTPITIPFNLTAAGQTANGAVVFNDDQLCGIFSGKITAYDGLTIATGGTAPTGPIKVIYRSDNSGTTFLLTQHLAAVCTAANSNITFSATQGFATLFGGTPPSNFAGANGSSGVQAAVLATDGAMGYLSPDFTQVAPSLNGNSSFPFAASVINHNDGVTYLPTSTNARNALGTPPAPSSAADLKDPTKFVPAAPDPSSGYPIVGFTTWEVAQCYADANTGNAIKGFLNGLYGNPALIFNLSQAGFTQVPGALTRAVTRNLLSNAGSGAGKLNIDIQNPAVCQSAGASGAGTYVGR